MRLSEEGVRVKAFHRCPGLEKVWIEKSRPTIFVVVLEHSLLNALGIQDFPWRGMVGRVNGRFDVQQTLPDEAINT